MNIEDAYEEVDKFYEIRGDMNGRKFVVNFLKITEELDIEPKDFKEWFNINGDKLGRCYNDSTRKQYLSVLRQFLKYLALVEQTNKIKKPKVVKQKTTKIYDTPYHFKKGIL